MPSSVQTLRGRFCTQQARVVALLRLRERADAAVQVRSVPTTAVPAQLTPVQNVTWAAGWQANKLSKPAPRRPPCSLPQARPQSWDPGAPPAKQSPPN